MSNGCEMTCATSCVQGLSISSSTYSPHSGTYDLVVLRNIHQSLNKGSLVMEIMGKEWLAKGFLPTTSEELADGRLLSGGMRYSTTGLGSRISGS